MPNRLSRLVLVALIALIAGCTPASPLASPTPSSEPAASRSVTVPSPSPSLGASPSEPEPDGSLLEGFGWNDILRVEVNGLAVRRAPYTHIPLAIGYRLDGTSTGEVRLNAGDFVSVDLGPVQIGDTTWYRVWPAEGGQLNYSSVWWDTQNNGPNPVEPGWVAASVGTDSYLTLHEAFEDDPQSSGLPATLLVSGIGDYLSEPQDGFDLYWLRWAYLIDEQGAPCEFSVTLVPVGGAGLLAVSESLIGAFEEGSTPVMRESFDPYQLAVSSDCEWTLRLQPGGHD